MALIGARDSPASDPEPDVSNVAVGTADAGTRRHAGSQDCHPMSYLMHYLSRSSVFFLLIHAVYLIDSNLKLVSIFNPLVQITRQTKGSLVILAGYLLLHTAIIRLAPVPATDSSWLPLPSRQIRHQSRW